MARPTSIAEVASARSARPDRPLWLPLAEFLDGFYEAEPGTAAAMLEEEPAAVIAREELAYLAAAAEYLSAVYRLAPPSWVNRSAYFLDVAYWPGPRGRALDAICIAESPTAFRRRFIFTEGRPLRRKGGPRYKSLAAGPAGPDVARPGT